jgi:predicted PurR-regulated permease PerM
MAMEPDRATSPGEASASWQRVARIALAGAVVAFGLWILHEFLAALAWAAVLAIALWPVYRYLQRLLPERDRWAIGPLLATTVVAIVIIAPIVLLGFAVARESHFVIQFFGDLRSQGIAVPGWIEQLPVVGATIGEWWRANLSDPVQAEELIGRVNLRTLTISAREYGGEVVHRLAILLFTLLTLFFFFRDGSVLTEQLRRLSDRVIGVRGELIALHMIAAVHGTVNGLVLVGLAEGILLGLVYFAVGLPYPASIGALTGVAAVIPFAAPIVYVAAGLYLLAVGNTFGGIVILVFGSVLLFVADHFVRPYLIGGAARVPFLLVLLGILGGLQTMGFLGLFLGPAVMAALTALWREWTEPEPVVQPARAASPRAAPRQSATRPRSRAARKT